MTNPNELELGDFSRHVGKCAKGFEGIYGGETLKEECYYIFVIRKSFL